MPNGVLQVRIPDTARADGYMSYDATEAVTMKKGSYVKLSTASIPLPTVSFSTRLGDVCLDHRAEVEGYEFCQRSTTSLVKALDVDAHKIFLPYLRVSVRVPRPNITLEYPALFRAAVDDLSCQRIRDVTFDGSNLSTVGTGGMVTLAAALIRLLVVAQAR